jgi:CMP-N-acetylneuraminic acid synthetase
MKKILCLILARGGSRRIPYKNIKKLAGKPLIAYTIECAKRSKYINRIIVSTNDIEIAKVAKDYGAEVPFFRPDELSKDDSTELDAFKHALGWLKVNESYEPDLIVKLFATAPFRSTKSVDKAITLLLDNPEADSVRSVKLCSEHPHKMWQIDGERLKSLIPVDQKQKEAHTLSYQILPEVYIQNAAIDVTKPDNVWEKDSITGINIVPFVMDEFESVDINNPLDFEFAEMLLKKKEK